MKEERIAELKARLAGHGPSEEERYTNQEVVDSLVDLQEAMANEVFALNHADHFAARDIMLHFGALAAEYGLQESDEFHRLSMNMRSLGCKIGSLKKGFAGERRTKEGLRVMTFDPDVRILYNLTLQDEVSKTEYDAIVITPYGIFVVESKNFRGAAYINEKGMLQRQDDVLAEYNLGEKMNNKEFLLRNCLGDLASVPYQGLLLYVDESANIIDDYKQIPIVFCNTVASVIRGFDKGENHISSEQVREIVKRITEHSVENKYPCRVDCRQIIDDFALLMSEIEERADEVNQKENDKVAARPVFHEVPKVQPQTVKVQKRRVWPQVLGGVALFAGGIAIGRKL